MADSRRRVGELVELASSALFHGGQNLDQIPGLLRQLLESQGWREFVTGTGEVVTHQRFEAFVTTPPVKGLGADLALVKRMVADDTVTVDLLDQTLKNPAGHPLASFDNIQGKAPTGTSSDAALRRLRKDAPELHADVLAGNLTAHAAMVSAGFRPRTATVRLDDPARAVRTLLRHFTAEQLRGALAQQP